MELKYGFTLTCNSCGNTTQLTQSTTDCSIDFSNPSIDSDTYGGYGWWGFNCKNCDEEIEGEY